MLLRALHTSGFWPVISDMADTASSMCFLSAIALPTPMLTTIFWIRGSDRRFSRPSFSRKRRAESPSRTAPSAAARAALRGLRFACVFLFLFFGRGLSHRSYAFMLSASRVVSTAAT